MYGTVTGISVSISINININININTQKFFTVIYTGDKMKNVDRACSTMGEMVVAQQGFGGETRGK